MSKELSIINAMLAETGALPLSAADDQHPNYIEASSVLKRAKDRLFSKPLWFNTEKRTLKQNASGEVVLPNGTLIADPTDPRKNYVPKDGKLWDADERTFAISEDVEVSITYNIEDIELLPQSAVNYLETTAVFLFLRKSTDALQINAIAADMRDAKLEFEADNLAAMDVNFFNGKGYAAHVTRRRGFGMTLPPYE